MDLAGREREVPSREKGEEYRGPRSPWGTGRAIYRPRRNNHTEFVSGRATSPDGSARPSMKLPALAVCSRADGLSSLRPHFSSRSSRIGGNFPPAPTICQDLGPAPQGYAASLFP